MANILFDIRTATKVNKIYSDKKTGAKAGVSIFEADLNNIPQGSYIIGQVAVPQTNAEYVPSSSIILVKPTGSHLVATPVNYEKKWNDKGSGGEQDCTFWRVIPPSGYVSLCDVVTSTYSEPTTDFTSKFACLRESDLILAKINDLPIWTDKGSGAHSDGSIWQVDGPGVAGFFKVQAGYQKPSDIEVYVLPAKVVAKN